MTSNALKSAIRSKSRIYLASEKLKLRKRLAGGDVYIDYGWIKLLFSDDQDRQEIYYHLNQREWHEADMAIFSRYVTGGSTVLDIGANLGFVTTMLASLVGPAGRVISFEPSRATYMKLKKTIAVNELAQVTAHNCGIGAEAGSLELVSVSKSSGNNTLVPVDIDDDTDREVVDIITLDEAPDLEHLKVSLIKIDTEGFEFNVLQGCRGLIERDHPVIHIELGGGGRYADTTHSAISLLEELDYDASPVRGIDWAGVGNGVDFTFVPAV